jgi:hypothetical protein
MRDKILKAIAGQCISDEAAKQAVDLVMEIFKTRIEDSTTWFCTKCKDDVDGCNVTYAETHEGCGGNCI